MRRVGPDGNITTVAGGSTAGFSGDGGPAADARLRAPRGLAIDADGNLLIADTGNGRVRRVGTDGRIGTIAGGGAPAQGNGDGEAATAARIVRPQGLAITPDGGLLLIDNGAGRLRRIDPDGTIRTVAGGGNGSSQDEGPATASALLDPRSVAVDPTGAVYIAETGRHMVDKAAQLLKGYAEGDLLIASEDGRRIYQFNENGRHLRTRDALTGGIIHQFGYDAQGRLASVSDGDGVLLTIDRSDGSVALVARGGQRTELAISAAGNLTKVTNPAGEAVTLAYGAGGLLTGLEEPGGDDHTFSYDGEGRLTSDVGPTGYTQTLTRTKTANGQVVEHVTSQNRKTTYRYEELATGDIRRTVTDPAGGVTTSVRRTDGTVHLEQADGTTVDLTMEPDPRFGMQAPVAASEIETTPGPSPRTRTTTRSVSSTVDGTELQSRTESISVNSRTSQRVYTDDGDSGGTLTSTTPAGRQTVARLDEQGRIVEASKAAGTLPLETSYDARGRVFRVEQGDRSWTYGFDAKDRAITRTNALGQVVQFAYDDADRMTTMTTDGDRAWSYTYDDDGNRTSITTPLGRTYGFTFTPDDRVDTMSLPGPATGYDRAYSADRQLSSRTEPGGATQTWSYDAGARLAGISSPDSTAGFTYQDGTELLKEATWNTGGGAPEHTLAMTFQGRLPKSMTTDAGSYAYTPDNDHQLTEYTVSAGGDQRTYDIDRDADRRVVKHGPYTITRDSDTGEPRSIADGTTTLSEDHDGYGGLSERQLATGGTEHYTLKVERDDSGQVSQRTETVGGTEHVYTYAYDSDNRLKEVTKDGGSVESYTYDDGGNRTSGGAQYDAQDRLTKLGATTYAWDANGFLAGRGSDSFDYGVRGELLSATVGGTTVGYAYDAFGRRTARSQGGDTEKYLYGNPDDPFQLTGSVAPSGALTTYFYDDEGALHGFERGGKRYAVGADQVNSPVVVVDDAGTIVKRVERDTWGRVVSDSAGGFGLPVGYAGGIADPVTGLVRFGMRDYDPAAGRWTARDPAFFEGSPINLYAYVGNDPASLRDPSGLICIGMSGYLGIGGGFSLCADGNGVGACAELGVGLSGGVEADLTGSPENSDVGFAEANLKVGPAGVTVGGEWDDCGNWKAGVSVAAGPVSAGGSYGSAGLQGQVKVGAGLEVGAKAGVKSCRSFSF